MRLGAVVLTAALAACGGVNQVADVEDSGPGDAGESAGLDAGTGVDASAPGRDAGTDAGADAGSDAEVDGGPHALVITHARAVETSKASGCEYFLSFWSENTTGAPLSAQMFAVCYDAGGTATVSAAPSGTPGDLDPKTISLAPGNQPGGWKFSGSCCQRIEVRVDLMASGETVAAEAEIVR